MGESNLQRVGFVIILVALVVGAMGCEAKNYTEEQKTKFEKQRSDENMNVPEWYRNGYYLAAAAIPGKEGETEVKFTCNRLLVGMFAVHLILGSILVNAWMFYQWNPMYVYSSLYGGYLQPMSVPKSIVLSYVLKSTFVLAIASVLFWLLSMMVASAWNREAFVPFDWVVFLTMGATYVAVCPLFAMWRIQAMIRYRFYLANPVQESSHDLASPNESSSHDSITASSNMSPRHGRIFRAVGKACFMAFATGAAAKFGGWVAGMIVLGIMAGISAYFEIAPPRSDE